MYRPKHVWWLFVVLFVAFLLALGTGFVTGWIPSSDDEPAWVVPVMVSLCVLVAVLTIVSLASNRIVLRGADEIELGQLAFGSLRLRRDEIRGRRLLAAPFAWKLILERSDGRKPAEIELICERDDRLNAFIASLPDLDEIDRRVAETAVLRQLEDHGASDEERRRVLARGHRIAWWMNRIAVAAIGWAAIYPWPYELAVVVLSALPLTALAVYARWRGVFGLVDVRNDPRPHLIPALMLPPLLLVVRSAADFSLADFHVIASVAATVGVVLVSFVVAVTRRDDRRPVAILVFGLVATAYGWGVASQANAVLDRGAPQTHEVEVRAERIVSGREPSAYLTLAPWGPFEDEAEYVVHRDVHDHITVGGAACIRVHPGALGARWYTIRACD